MTTLPLPPLSLYVHIPWCVKKCPYCDFNSHTSTEIPEQAYLAQLKKDLSADLCFVQGRSLTSIFFGGGTPSLMSGAFYADLLEFISSQIAFEDDIEITLEANPGTTEAERFVDYRRAGINRLSVGVQSFHDKHLKVLGRIHSGSDAKRAITQAKQAGFDNFNIDLMHGLSGQSPDEAIDDIKQALALGPTHLSWYQLTIEQNTEYFRHPPKLPEEDALWDIQKQGSAVLKEAGFGQYEISAFSLEGRNAKHNLNYWTFGDYIGIGAGAHAKVTCLASEQPSIIRYRKTRIPNDYLKAQYNLQPSPSYRIAEEVIEASELGFEFMMNALRLKQGVKADLFADRTGLPLSNLEPQLGELQNRGLIEKNVFDDGHCATLCTTEKGYLFLNSVLEKFAES